MAEVQQAAAECPQCHCSKPGTGWPVDEHLGRVIHGKYRVEEKLGTGGFGVVLRARHIKEGHDLGDVVLKFLHPQMASSHSFRQRFLNEAKAARKLASPHIIKVFDFDFDERGHPYIVMEYLEGELLNALIKRGRMEPERVVRIGLQIASALQACHAADVVHRDLTPRNIILLAGQREDFVKVLDFGIARLPDTTLSLSTLGTPRYMPPEQIMQKDLDHRADIFAFGVILFQCFAGEPPILAEQPAEYLHLNLAEQPRSLRALAPSLSERLDQLLETMMAKDREHRPGSMAAIEEQLVEISVAEGWLPVGYRVVALDARETTLWRRTPVDQAAATVESVVSDEETELETRTVTETGSEAEIMTESGEGHSGGTLVPVVRESSGPPPHRQLLIWGIAITVIAVLGVALFFMVVSLPLAPTTSELPPDLQVLPRHPAAPRVVEPDQAIADSGVDALDGGLADTASADHDAQPVRRVRWGPSTKRKRPRRPALRPKSPEKPTGEVKGGATDKDENSFKRVPGGL